MTPETNRQNAQHSTGPRTEPGKQASRLNARKDKYTGQIVLMQPSDRDAHDIFCARLIADLAPVGDLETQYAQLIATAHWRINRWNAHEENLYSIEFLETNPDPNPELGALLARTKAFLDNTKQLNLLSLYIQRATREIERYTKALSELKAERESIRLSELAAASEARLEAQAQGKPFDVAAHARARIALKSANPEPSTASRSFGFVFSTADLDAFDAAKPVRIGAKSQPKEVLKAA